MSSLVTQCVGNLVELLEVQTQERGDSEAFTFLLDGEQQTATLSYAQLAERARAIAARLADLNLTGEPVVVACPPGLDYLASFFGCLYAGAIAVPAHSPSGHRFRSKLTSIIRDSGARACLTTSGLAPTMLEGTASDGIDNLACIGVDEISSSEAAGFHPCRANEIAFLQYTSGSTGSPKGVVQAHSNVLANLGCIHEISQLTPSDRGVHWLPLFHDMGLLFALYGLYAAFPCTLMSPIHVLQHPFLWLNAISSQGATCSGGPNFGYALCAASVTPLQASRLDLSSWRVAFTGAEPIRAQTLDEFQRKFGPSGFANASFRPCYGLAEFTVFATGSQCAAGPCIAHVSPSALANGQVEEVSPNATSLPVARIVSSGVAASNHTVQVVDPEVRVSLPDSVVGEVWLAGPSMGQGYWRRPTESEQIFNAHLRCGEGPFLRTGDLGFLRDGQLYITGRAKELIIIRGSNYYPVDIEATVENAHDAILQNNSGAFSIERDGEEKLVIFVELSRHLGVPEREELISQVRSAVSREHTLAVHALVLLRPGRLPRTTSGKVQRAACRDAFDQNDCSGVIYQWTAHTTPQTQGSCNGRSHRTEVQSSSSTPRGFDEPLPNELSRHAQSPAPERAPTSTDTTVEPIAVVGMGCRFPQAENPEKLLQLLRAGGDAVREIPRERWDVDELYDPDPDEPGKMHTKWGGFLDEVDQFDAQFFGITPREAERMDPQQRLLLEVAWEALENAGYAGSIAGTRTGVYIGIGGFDYSTLQMQRDGHLTAIDAYMGTGNTHSIAANRLSFLFDLRGPSMSVDTACSSSLIAMHLACQAIRNRECDTALCGGVNLILSPEVTIAFSKARMLSPSGRCKTFDDSADGYARGEGCGILVLKRLSAAIEDGDSVLAVVQGTAANQDGRTSGITAPSAEAQQAVMRSALSQSGITPDELTYVEAHGTATPLGDPIEMGSLRAVVGAPSDSASCLVGSIKANIGHTETASGVASVIKVILMLQNAEIFPQVHFDQLNHRINLEDSRLAIATERRPWIVPDGKRIAGVNSFGFGGANAHVILEEPPRLRYQPSQYERPQHALVLSAASDNSLKELAGAFSETLKRQVNSAVPDVCHGAAAGRQHFRHRLAVTGNTTAQLRKGLAAFIADEQSDYISGVAQTPEPRVAMLFSGQGSQYPGVGQELYETQPTFRRVLEQCNEIFVAHAGHSLLEVLQAGSEDEAAIHQTKNTQAALFAVEYALAQLWFSWGVKPVAMLGHSIGEYVAACLAGVFTLEDAFKLVVARGRLMQSAPRGGGMVVAQASEAQVRPLLEEYRTLLSIAAVNTPHSTVISGDSTALQEVAERLRAMGVGTKALTVSHAFHSPLMDPVLDEFESFASQFTFEAPRLPLVSNLTGSLFGENECPDAAYWRHHLRQTVQFADGIRALQDECDIFLELGPSATLIAAGQQCLSSPKKHWLSSLRKGQSDWDQMLKCITHLYVSGVPVNWHGFDADYKRRHISLPNYRFDRETFWMQGTGSTADRQIAARTLPKDAHPLLGARQRSALPMTQFESEISLNRLRYLADHKIQGTTVLPGAAYVELGLAAAKAVTGQLPYQVSNVEFRDALTVADERTVALQVVVLPESGRRSTFDVYSQPVLPESQEEPQTTWSQNVTGAINHSGSDDGAPASWDILKVRERCGSQIETDRFYEQLRQHGLEYGPSFRGVVELWAGDGEALATVETAGEIVSQQDRYLLHPTILDSCFHVAAAALFAKADELSGIYLPTGAKSITYHQRPSKSSLCHAVITSDHTGDIIEADLTLLDLSGHVLVTVTGLRFQRLPVLSERNVDLSVALQQWLYQVVWHRKDLPEMSGLPEQGCRGTWIVYADQTGIGDSLAALLDQHGGDVLVLTPGDTNEQIGQGRYRVDASAPASLSAMLTEALGERRQPIRGVIHLWALENESSQFTNAEEIKIAQRRACDSIAQAVRDLNQQQLAPDPGFWLVTRQAQDLGRDQAPVSVFQTPAIGIGLTLEQEHPEYVVQIVDLDLDMDCEESVELLFEEISDSGRDVEVAFRGGKRWVARIEHCSTEFVDQEIGGETMCAGEISAGQPFRLEVGKSKTIDGLALQHTKTQMPEAGQVQIEVCATGLNFSDVLKSMGLYPGITDSVTPLGIECAGRVAAIGEGVTRFEIGDEVIALCPYSFSNYAITYEFGVMPKPAEMSFEEAATIPVAYMTAYYALIELAQLKPNERVLIHAAAGGVGQAAIQIAQQCGAEIFATAGTPEKRDFLRALGIQHVMDSRRLDFADQIEASTNGEGVDVVLNSLAGEFIPSSLKCLRAYGRFLEIGKTDIYLNRSLGLYPFQDNLSYHAIDMDRMFRQRPDLIRRLFNELMEYFEQGSLRPLPATRFDLNDILNAFRYMVQRKNIGKVVVSMIPEFDDGGTEIGRAQIRDDASYLVTGGLGALGLLTAESLVESGARNVVLMGRNDPTDAALEQIHKLRQTGANIVPVKADVSVKQDLDRVLTEMRETMPPMRGVIHAAGLLRDNVLLQLDGDAFDQVLAPKVAGSWNLHEATSGLSLDFFVLFSSVSASLGSIGQANYAAGNAFLDGLARHRQRLGLPATAIAWGPWAEIGMAASDLQQQEMARRGFDPLPTDITLELFRRARAMKSPHLCVMAVDWRQATRLYRGSPPSLVKHLVDESPEVGKKAVNEAFLADLLSLPRSDREQRLASHFLNQLARITGQDRDRIDEDLPLNSLGLDSLMAIELKNSLESSLDVSISIGKFFEDPSIRSLSQHVLDLIDSETETVPASYVESTNADVAVPSEQHQ